MKRCFDAVTAFCVTIQEWVPCFAAGPSRLSVQENRVSRPGCQSWKCCTYPWRQCSQTFLESNSCQKCFLVAIAESEQQIFRQVSGSLIAQNNLLEVSKPPYNLLEVSKPPYNLLKVSLADPQEHFRDTEQQILRVETVSRSKWIAARPPTPSMWNPLSRLVSVRYYGACAGTWTMRELWTTFQTVFICNSTSLRSKGLCY